MNIEQEYIKKVESLVPCPTIALEVLELAHDPDCNFDNLARKIESDPSLTANMLHMANSAYFGHMRKIASVRDIVIRLGIASVKLIAITGASVGLLKNPQDAYNLKAGALWQHSQATASLAAIIGSHAKITDSFSLYTGALLHDIGKIILNKPLLAAGYDKNVTVTAGNLLQVEQKYLQTDHAKVGMFLLENWGLPAEITVPVGFHHDYKEAVVHKEATRIVHLANALVEGMGFVAENQAMPTIDVEEVIDEEVYSSIPHFQEDMEQIIEEFYQKINEASSLNLES